MTKKLLPLGLQLLNPGPAIEYICKYEVLSFIVSGLALPYSVWLSEHVW